MLCRKCGIEVPHACQPEHLVGRAVVDCPIAKGSIWVQVTGQGAGIEGVSVRAAGRTVPTDPTGFVGFDPLDEDDYEVEVLAIPDLRQPDYGLPLVARSPAPVRTGEITFLAFELARRVKPRITLSAAVVGVGGARITATLVAEPPFEGHGRGTLTVAAGAASIRLHRGAVPVNLVANAVTFDSVPAAGIVLEIEAVNHSAFEGITLQWGLASDTRPVAAGTVQEVATAAKAELVAETATGTVLGNQQQRVDGGVVHLQNPAGQRARLKVTPRCQPPELVGQLRLTAIKGNIAVYDAAVGGLVVDLATPIDVGPGRVLAPVYVQGNAVSDPVADTGLRLALVGVVDQADLVKLTVVEISLDVYGGTPGPSDPAVLLADDRKVDPGRRLYVQDVDHWWWGRAKVRLTKNPPLAPCSLSLRAAGLGAIRLFAETGANPQGQVVSLEAHVEGEAAVPLPIALAVDALPDPVAGRVYWAEGVTTTAAGVRDLFVDIVDVENEVDHLAFRVLPPLAEFDRINLVDLGGPGSGHQAAVVKLIGSLATIGYAGDVVLSYNRKKTRIYGNALGRGAALNHPAQSYALYHDVEWAGTCTVPGRPPLAVRCRPIGALDIALTGAQGRMPQAPLDVQGFWTTYGWPGAALAPFTDPNPGGFGAVAALWRERLKWSTTNDAPTRLEDGTFIPRYLFEQRTWRQTKVYDQETGATMASDAELLELQPPVPRTLNAFGAMDCHTNDPVEAALPTFKTTYFDNHWLPVLRRMTREAHPVAMSFQPFLWTEGHPMQVRQDTIVVPPVDVVAKVLAVGGKPVYRLVPRPPGGDAGVVAALPDVPRTILQAAMAGEVHLISAYYGAPVSDIAYDQLLRVMVRMIKGAAPNIPVVVVLMGDDMKEAHTTVVRALNDDTVIARVDTGVRGLDVEVELAHIGRTTAMTQFQRYSKLFVTEGANTWQEVLTLGTPTLSVKPGGNTRPWLENPPAVPGADTVRAASLALIAAQDPADAGALATLVEFFNHALDGGSELVAYFHAWRDLLLDPHSDQVVVAVNHLPDPADNV